MPFLLEIQNLRKTYKSKKALDGVSFSVKEKSCFGLLGPNGAGKSTTMKILTGVLTSDGGSINMFGKDARKNRKAILQHIGYVPQDIVLYEKLSAYDNLVFFGKCYGLDGDVLKERINDVLKQTGLSDRAKDTVKSYSGGMKRRINIAAALLHKPKLLILDEPTVGIDPQSRNHIFDMIRSLKEQGTTMIYSTHYMEEVEALCDEIAIIDNGEVVTQGTLDYLFTEYGRKAVYMESKTNFPTEKLTGIEAVHSHHQGLIIETAAPVDLMEQIIHISKEQKILLHHLEIEKPSLESVFLSLTGKTLRD
ncbi:ABC transporter ATP-binding protein [Terrilactibacillus laevilacticus]|uniref:ABC transporter ATP-binding protein n=1 Tax=Terrilactibacillus laevilacticus TaxID=1380157 RepID=A0ABW5PMS3_9BACI|nr:ABC transporter ATP-binding protein [Terrilactibacillus laevilacticus]